MRIEQDIGRMTEQERRLCFARFDNDTAWELGTRIRSLCASRGLALAIEVRAMRETVFFCAMQGTTAENADWVRRKRNTVERLQRSSYAVGRSLELEGLTLEQKMGLPLREFASHGGAFPIRVAGVGCVGAVTVSGAPQREDHAIVVAGLAAMCGVPLGEVALD
jgi:uncharacterized protein (UPF0303 family)